MPPHDRPEWPLLRERTSTLGIRILLAVQKVLGDKTLRLILKPVLASYWLTSPRLRQVVGAYQRRVEKLAPFLSSFGSPEPGLFSGIAQLEHFALAIFEKFAALSGDGKCARLDVVAEEIFSSDGKTSGAVILTSHTGCQELLMTSSSGFTEHEIVILQHTAHARKFNDLLAKAGAKPPQATFFEIGETLSPALVMELSERASKGAYIILAGDRVPMGSDAAASVSFLGDPARFPTGGALLSLLLGIPLRMMVCTRPDLKERRYRVCFYSLCERPPRVRRAAREAWLASMAALYAGSLEAELLRSPIDWAHYFDFWEDFRK